MPRFRSLVTTLSSACPTVRTHTLRTPSSAARYANCFPSGEIWGDALSGFPKNTSRGISGGNSPHTLGPNQTHAANATLNGSRTFMFLLLVLGWAGLTVDPRISWLTYSGIPKLVFDDPTQSCNQGEPGRLCNPVAVRGRHFTNYRENE